MKMKIAISMLIAAFCAVGCASARVIQETDRTAVIQGMGPTEFEAKDNATKKAEEILGSVKETQKPECNQEVHGGGSTDAVTGAYKSSVGTHYSCVMYFEKK